MPCVHEHTQIHVHLYTLVNMHVLCMLCMHIHTYRKKGRERESCDTGVNSHMVLGWGREQGNMLPKVFPMGCRSLGGDAGF